MLRRVAATTTVMIYCQILLGATMRHIGAGMAIPDFPWVFGGVLPPVWNAGIAIHFAHRVGALLVTIAILATAGHVWYHHRSRPELVRPATLLVLFVLTQITLGAFVVLSGLQPIINTAHVVNGALVLSTSLVLTLRSHRSLFAEAPAAGASRDVERGRVAAGAREHREMPAIQHRTSSLMR